jgi:hypothetical protein
MTSQRGVVTYPTPLYRNVHINAEYFQPRRFVISGVALGTTTIITTTCDMNYVIGQEIRLIIPASFGCFQLNTRTGFVISLPAKNQVEVNINSNVNVDPYQSSTATTIAQILAIGDVNTGYQSCTGEVIPTICGNTHIEIPGSFINISPY